MTTDNKFYLLPRTLEVVYTWPSGKREVRYRREEHTIDAIDLQDQVDRMRDKQGDDCPYSYRFVENNCESWQHGNDNMGSGNLHGDHPMTDNKFSIGKQRLRRWAYTHAGLVIENALAAGWPYENLEDKGWVASDIDAIDEKLHEIIADLFSRGLNEQDEKFFTSDNSDEK